MQAIDHEETEAGQSRRLGMTGTSYTDTGLAAEVAVLVLGGVVAVPVVDGRGALPAEAAEHAAFVLTRVFQERERVVGMRRDHEAMRRWGEWGFGNAGINAGSAGFR